MLSLRRATALSCAAALGLLSALIAVPGVVAQATSLTPGARIRVSAPSREIQNRPGTLVRVTPDSLTIDFRRNAGPVTVPLDALSRLDVSTGKRRQAGFWRGAGIGFLITGAIVGATVLATRDCGEDCQVPLLIYGGSGLVLGTIVGGVIGSRRAPDRWEAFPLGRPTAVSRVIDRPAGARVAFSIPF
jgi:hypothetical protein